MSDEIDERTLRRAQRGEDDACRALVGRYQGPVFALLGRMLGQGRRDVVEDLAQETFLHVFRSLESFSPLGAARLSSWILTIASRRAIDELPRRPPPTEPLSQDGVEVAVAEFVDRVMAAREAAAREPPPPRLDVPPGRTPALKWGSVAVIVGAAAIGFVALRGSPAFPGAGGELRAEQRRSIRLAHRGVAVAEPGAELSWTVASSGAAAVNQKAGSVFYRVERGGTFAIDTPSGRVEVTGTCFRVEVGALDNSKNATVGATLVVTVYEGSVVFTDKSGDTKTARAGETIVVSSPAEVDVRQ